MYQKITRYKILHFSENIFHKKKKKIIKILIKICKKRLKNDNR